jgi:hypothetical protein
MTWVVAASTLFGYGVVMSDIQVTDAANDMRADLLQKAYPVSKYVMAGFAGDVFAGLNLLENMGRFLNTQPVPDGECWDPQWVAENWPEHARMIFAESGKQQRVNETHIIMLGLQSKPDVLGNAIGHISVFRSPDFQPESKKGGRQAMSVGCGSNVAKYTSVLEELMVDENLQYMKAELNSIGGYGRLVTETLCRTSLLHPTEGISRHFQVFLMRMGDIQQWNTPGMPAVTQSWHDLLRSLPSNMGSDALLA